MRQPYKKGLPVDRVGHYLEPGPIVMVSSALGEQRNVMTLGWHAVLESSPSLVGLMISAGNHSFSLIRQSGECVINLPTTTRTEIVVGVGNTSGAQIDKFNHFGLTPLQADTVAAPLIAECHACFECRLFESALIDRFNFFVFEIVKAHVAPTPQQPGTLRYRGDDSFMVSGKVISRRGLFHPEMLD